MTFGRTNWSLPGANLIIRDTNWLPGRSVRGTLMGLSRYRASPRAKIRRILDLKRGRFLAPNGAKNDNLEKSFLTFWKLVIFWSFSGKGFGRGGIRTGQGRTGDMGEIWAPRMPWTGHLGETGYLRRQMELPVLDIAELRLGLSRTGQKQVLFRTCFDRSSKIGLNFLFFLK